MKVKQIKLLIFVLCFVTLMTCMTSCASEEISRDEELSMTEAVDRLNNEAASNDYVLVSFEGLGLFPIVINKAVFKIGNFTVYWSGVLVVAAALLTLGYVLIASKKALVKSEDVFDVMIYGIVAAVLGSRLLYVLTSADKLKSSWSVFEFWDGGTSIFGAIIGCIFAIYVVCKIKKTSPMKMLDLVAPAALLGQMIGRFADFINGTSYGYELREGNLFYGLRMGVYPHLTSSSGIEAGNTSIAYVHPTFLYEIVWNLVGFILLTVFMRKKKFDGQKFYFYMAWYGFGRTFIELLRTDSLNIFESIKISVLLGCLFFFAGVALLIYSFIQGEKVRLAGEEYESAYPLFHTKSALDTTTEKESDPDSETDNGKGE